MMRSIEIRDVAGPVAKSATTAASHTAQSVRATGTASAMPGASAKTNAIATKAKSARTENHARKRSLTTWNRNAREDGLQHRATRGAFDLGFGLNDQTVRKYERSNILHVVGRYIGTPIDR